MLESVRNGWYPLSATCELLYEHGVPRQLACEGDEVEADDTLAACVQTDSGLEVTVGAWQTGEGGQRLAALAVQRSGFDEVLARLARTSAATFFDRYVAAPSGKDEDFKVEAYASDFVSAMNCCGLVWDDVDKDAHEAAWRAVLEQESRKLVACDGQVAAD